MRIDTERLVVRQFESSDVDALHAVCSDPEVVRFVDVGEPLSRDQCELWIERSLANYESRGYGAAAVIERATGAFIGYAGIVYAPDRTEPEIIYAFEKAAWGRGLASELVPPLVRFGLIDCGLPLLLATIAGENTPSRRVVEKCGFRLRELEANPDGSTTAVYEIIRESAAGAIEPEPTA